MVICEVQPQKEQIHEIPISKVDCNLLFGKPWNKRNILSCSQNIKDISCFSHYKICQNAAGIFHPTQVKRKKYIVGLGGALVQENFSI